MFPSAAQQGGFFLFNFPLNQCCCVDREGLRRNIRLIAVMQGDFLDQLEAGGQWQSCAMGTSSCFRAEFERTDATHRLKSLYRQKVQDAVT